MKICMFSTSDIGHGAGISAYNLLNGLVEHGHECTLYVSEKRSANPHVVEIHGDNFWWPLGKKLEKILAGSRFQSVFSANVLCTDIAKIANSYDVINCHNLHWHHDSLSPLLFWLLRKPIVWTVHDMWPITGHCIFNYESCDGYTSMCSQSCPMPESYIPLKQGEISSALRIKQWIYARAKLHVVSPSRWLSACIEASPALKPVSLHTIPYSVDTAVFYVQDRVQARERLGLGQSAFTLLFSAGTLQDRRKGIQFFVKALLTLADKAKEIQILLVGAGKIPAYVSDIFTTHHLGEVNCRHTMAEIYACADITVVPTIADNLPNVVLESMACGSPVLGFDTGGVPDMIDDGLDGYVIRRENVAELAEKITFLLDNPRVLQKMSAAASQKMQSLYSPAAQVKKYEQLFARLLTKSIFASGGWGK